jgi:DNA-binding FadR family transcriptional regulator
LEPTSSTNSLHVPRRSRAEELADILEEEARQLEPQSRLGTKDEIRQRFGIAAGTLNESLRLLQARGVLEPRPGPGGGLFVSRPGASVRLSHLILRFREGETNTIADGLEVRNALELSLALHASQTASETDIAEMYEIVDSMEQVIDDPARFFHANWSLHRKIASLVPNVVLRTVYLAVLELAEEQLEAVGSDFTFPRSSTKNVAVHRELVAAIESKQEPRIRAAVKRHEPLTERRAKAQAEQMSTRRRA